MILHWLGIVLGCLAAVAPAEQIQSQTENSKKTSRGQAECGKFQGWVGAENHKTKCHIAKNPCDCIRANELCGWCADESFQYGRCDLPANLETLKCQDVQTVESKVYTGNADFNPEKDRIFPKDANAIIRVGDSVDLLFNVTEPRIYPAELYYLMDVSYSMRDDMERMKKMGGEIAKKLRDLTNQEAMVRIGFGTFVDKGMVQNE